ncbi:MAG: KOW domain-containing RNA-binding protein [Lachnospiraceae bacterium]|jgi:ribosomal protein L14E/L6E/L27E
MKELKEGMLAKSLAGHDKGQIYVIESIEGEYVYLADGKHRSLERTKKKNLKHIQPVKHIEVSCLCNETIKKVIKEYQLGQQTGG